MLKKITLVAVILAFAYAGAIFALDRKVDKWDWSKINTNPDTMEIKVPKGFLWGVASASFQVEGGHDVSDSWGWWETQKNSEGKPRVEGKAGVGNDEWNLYPTDIAEMKRLGLNSYRFSLSWSKIMPTADTVNEVALAHYDKMINDLLEAGIEPMLTLHHFSHPTWFEEKGAFDKEENIDDFVKFSKLVFERYGDRVKLWGTFNEPAVYGYGRHIDLAFPHNFQQPDFNRLGVMLKNVLIAHDKVYTALKAMPNGDKAKIGIVKSMMQMDAYNRYDLGDQIIAHYAQKLFADAFVDYFTTGQFDFTAPPVGADVVYNSPTPKKTHLDFIGLNYYSHNAFDVQYTDFDLDKWASPLVYPNEMDTGLNYGFYPEGLYRAIREISRVGKPIYITENGIGVPASQEEIRQQHLTSSLYDVSKAIKDGYDVRAFYYWSLNDNFEWEYGYSKTFGLYSVDRNSPTLERTPKPTAEIYRKLVAKSQ